MLELVSILEYSSGSFRKCALNLKCQIHSEASHDRFCSFVFVWSIMFEIARGIRYSKIHLESIVFENVREIRYPSKKSIDGMLTKIL